MNVVMTGHSTQHDIGVSYHIEEEINQLRNKQKAENINAVDEHEYDYAMGTMFNDMINECEKLGDYVVNVVQARFGV
jgi:phosphate:Na+ symporter